MFTVCGFIVINYDRTCLKVHFSNLQSFPILKIRPDQTCIDYGKLSGGDVCKSEINGVHITAIAAGNYVCDYVDVEGN